MKAAPHRLKTPRTPPAPLDKRRRERKARTARPSPLSAEQLAEIDASSAAAVNVIRAEQRRELYAGDPLWRLSKLKDNRERRLRAKRAALAAARLAELELAALELRRRQLAERRVRAPYRPREPRLPRRLELAAAGGFSRAARASENKVPTTRLELLAA